MAKQQAFKIVQSHSSSKTFIVNHQSCNFKIVPDVGLFILGIKLQRRVIMKQSLMVAQVCNVKSFVSYNPFFFCVSLHIVQ